MHEGYLRVTKDPTGTVRFTDRDGRSPRAPFVAREVVIGRRAPATAANARALSEIVPRYLEPHEVPAVVDGAWWLQHQHCFEWTRDSRGIRLRRPPRA